jgi:small subunit ribosomal protein S21
LTWPRESGDVTRTELDCRDDRPACSRPAKKYAVTLILTIATRLLRNWLHAGLPHSQPSEKFQVQVLVRDNNIDQALRVLKKKMQREGVFREMKQRRSYEKPSERKTREKSEAIRRARKLARKQAIREGLLPAPPKKKLPERKPPLPETTSKERA